MRLKIFTTGGTIDKVYFDQKSQYEVGDPQAGGLLERANVVIDYEVVSILRQDSLDITEHDRELIRRAVEAAPEEQIVITHGTDTMLDTAKTLKGIPDILTGKVISTSHEENKKIK